VASGDLRYLNTYRDLCQLIVLRKLSIKEKVQIGDFEISKRCQHLCQMIALRKFGINEKIMRIKIIQAHFVMIPYQPQSSENICGCILRVH
jgi:hypothetical protein